jgi:hypothetical protein
VAAEAGDPGARGAALWLPKRAIRVRAARVAAAGAGGPGASRRGLRSQNDDEPPLGAAREERTGGDLLSQALASQVPSALWGLTALFGMGRGVSPTQ